MNEGLGHGEVAGEKKSFVVVAVRKRIVKVGPFPPLCAANLLVC